VRWILTTKKEVTFMIQMHSGDVKKLIDHARSQLPDEACGLLAGVEENGLRQVKRVYLIENEDASPEHFSMSPQNQLAAIKDMRANGLTLLGNWHSHPGTPSRPSAEDVKLAYDPYASYLILSLEAPQVPNLNAFRIQNGEYQWDILEILPEESP
jgi:proteasome lid subunit RPN8/RPN11